MLRFRLSPFVSFVESHLIPGVVQHGVFHRLTGEVLEPSERIRALLHAATMGNCISLNDKNLTSFGQEGAQLEQIFKKDFLIEIDSDPLTPFLGQHVIRPLQNPALMYQAKGGEISLVHTSMAHRVYSPATNDLPKITEEPVPPLSAEIFKLADGKKTLVEITNLLLVNDHTDFHQSLREAIDFLTAPERQLVKFTRQLEDMDNPFKPFNCVPRSFYHSSRWDASSRPETPELQRDFHLHGIEDSSWEFDQIEPTLNHAFRFSSEVLGGFDYGARFCQVAMRPEVLPQLPDLVTLRVLEVGGGTGSFARSFIQQAKQLDHAHGVKLDYYILDLSPVLMECQKELLGDLLPAANHFHQDATEFNIPERTFDLIIANEVIADFPVAEIHRRSGESSTAQPRTLNSKVWEGSGADYLKRYDLEDEGSPDHYLINAGAFRFIERAWQHLSPGGTLIITEYGAEHRYPAQSFHLNHEEYSIHFGHLKRCAAKVGFSSRLLALSDFLGVDDKVLVLNGREERILCLNHILRKYGLSIPYSVISKSEFDCRFREIVEDLEMTGLSFSPLYRAFYYGPRMDDFMALILNKPFI
ncbi:MAG TPA: class I SAM-dependent methyltransferase [Pyrinomonadaceae bacterium]|nr:class I SAM-dependent methyltransferase [Pyrinomonadaceae bacterium]